MPGWRPTWDRCVTAARLADAARFEAIVPLARWKGFLENAPQHIGHWCLDPFVFAAGVAAQTSHAAVFSTVQAASMHPVVAAKQGATIDEISGGRFCLNVVAGWNRMDNEMLGMPVLPHATRYDFLREWLAAVQGLWGDRHETTVDGQYVKMLGGISRPQPPQGRKVPIMNAGLSETGARFAARHADVALVNLRSDEPDLLRVDVEHYKSLAREEYGRELQVWTNAVVLQRESEERADTELRQFMDEQLDRGALEAFMAMMGAETSLQPGTPAYEVTTQRVGYGGGYLLRGSARTIADRLRALAEAGVDGAILVWADPVDGLKRFANDILPELKRLGLRSPT